MVLDIIEEEKLNERAEMIGSHVMKKFAEPSQRFACIGDIRGLGAMCAMEIVQDRNSKQPDKNLLKALSLKRTNAVCFY